MADTTTTLDENARRKSARTSSTIHKANKPTEIRSRLRINREGQSVRWGWLRRGRAGSVDELRQMATLVRDAVAHDLGLADFANEILNKSGAAGDVTRRTRGEIEALFKYVQKRIVFRRDPAGGMEAIQDARATLRRGYGDCDDFAVCLASLLGVVGFVCRFVVIRQNAAQSGFSHVYVEVQNPDEPGAWLALDASQKTGGIGFQARGIERRTFTIFGGDDRTDLEGFLDVFRNIGTGVQIGAGATGAVLGVVAQQRASAAHQRALDEYNRQQAAAFAEAQRQQQAAQQQAAQQAADAAAAEAARQAAQSSETTTTANTTSAAEIDNLIPGISNSWLLAGFAAFLFFRRS